MKEIIYKEETQKTEIPKKKKPIKATKAQLVDYIYQNFERDGKKLTRKELNSYQRETLENAIRKNKCVKEAEAWANRPKMIKFFVDGTLKGEDLIWDCEYESEEVCRKAFAKENISISKLVPQKGNHRCKYCRGIAEGTNKDLLCDDCHELFGHKFYSEL